MIPYWLLELITTLPELILKEEEVPPLIPSKQFPLIFNVPLPLITKLPLEPIWIPEQVVLDSESVIVEEPSNWIVTEELLPIEIGIFELEVKVNELKIKITLEREFDTIIFPEVQLPVILYVPVDVIVNVVSEIVVVPLESIIEVSENVIVESK